uniref:Phosphatidylinositol 4-phosphate 5-kinase 8 n=1 Tax=Zeugodacus cucurbitae TaxID=28588 RepID=A0A0A1XIS2_ZEUCU
MRRSDKQHDILEKQLGLAAQREEPLGAQGLHGPQQPQEPKELHGLPVLHEPHEPQLAKQPHCRPQGLHEHAPHIPHGPQVAPVLGNPHAPTDVQCLTAPQQQPLALQCSHTPQDTCELNGLQ